MNEIFYAFDLTKDILFDFLLIKIPCPICMETC